MHLFHRSLIRIAALSLAPGLAAGAGVCAPAPDQLASHHLGNGVVHARVSEQAGGRLLAFSLAGRPNVLLVDERAGDPALAPNAASDHVPWQGHEVWIGPQQDWWTSQDVHSARAAARAVWPPDPFLSLSRYALLQASDSTVKVASQASPVSGIALRKRYALLTDKPNSLQLDVTATNRGATALARDIWFNTRVPVDTLVLVPVARPADVRAEPLDALSHTVAEGILSLQIPAAGQAPRKGKLFIQPSGGWMAGFRAGQALIITFRLAPRAAIHPAQGQVELYQDADPGAPAKGLIEMEVHAPLVELAPGASMAASELWTILPYDGPAERGAQIAFLRRHAAQLGLDGLD